MKFSLKHSTSSMQSSHQVGPASSYPEIYVGVWSYSALLTAGATVYFTQPSIRSRICPYLSAENIFLKIVYPPSVSRSLLFHILAVLTMKLNK